MGLDVGARERVRLARALEKLPRLAFARGELSYAKVRALTACTETEERLLAIGRAGTAERVPSASFAAGGAWTAAEARETAQRHASRALHVYPSADGMVIVRGRLEPEAGAVLLQALTAGPRSLYKRAHAAVPDVPRRTPTMAQQQADALALIAETTLHSGIHPGVPGERYQVVVHVDADVLADGDSAESVVDDERLRGSVAARSGATQRESGGDAHDADGRAVEVGAKTRTIPPALLVGAAVTARCFPGWGHVPRPPP